MDFPSSSFDDQVLVSVAGDAKAKVVTITINNASKMNTMNQHVIGGVSVCRVVMSPGRGRGRGRGRRREESHHSPPPPQHTPQVTAALELCSDDPTVAVVVFTGTGDRAFCAGGNLQGGGASAGFRAEGRLATVTGAIRNLRASMHSAQLLRNSHFVSVAAVNGACAGAGLSWACACDLRVASANALFRAGFVTAGLSGGGSHLLCLSPPCLSSLMSHLSPLRLWGHMDLAAHHRGCEGA